MYMRTHTRARAHTCIVCIRLILTLDIAHRDLKPENILCEKVDEVHKRIHQHVAMVIIVT